MKTYLVLKAVSDVMGSAIVTADIAFHKVIGVLDTATTKIADAAGWSAVRAADRTVRNEVQRARLLQQKADELQGRADEASVDVDYTIDEQHDALIAALQALPSLSALLSIRLEQAINDNDSNRAGRA